MFVPGAAAPLAIYPGFPAGPDSLVLAAPAKLNLFLEVIRRRPDGYHDLESLLVAIDLFDTLEFRSGDASGKGGGLTLVCDPPGLPTGPENLVVKAAEVLRQRVGRVGWGVSIRLTKRIPSQAGLGGGSSDAAATLLGLNAVGKLAQTRDDLAAMAAAVGSDVAFFLTPPAAWCTGRGEVVEPEPLGGVLHFVVVCPPVGLSTPRVFAELRLPPAPRSGADLRAAVRAGDAEAIGRLTFNRLEEAALRLAPEVRTVRDRLARLGACGVQMTGSGSAVYAVCRSRSEALRVAADYRAACRAEEPGASDPRVFVVRSLAP